MNQDKLLKLVFFPPSPWSEKALWALDHSGLPYDKLEYTPLMTTPQVRWLSRNFTKKLTIPVALDGGKIMRDSFDIAVHANSKRLKSRPNLFPTNKMTEIKQWNELSDTLLNILRARANPRMKKNRDVLVNNLPPYLPSLIKLFLTPVSRYALNHLAKKYPLPSGDHEQIVLSGVTKLRVALDNSQGDYLLGDFSYADICMAAVFQAIQPENQNFVKLDDATRECWHDKAIINESKDLIVWRDKLYKNHRLHA